MKRALLDTEKYINYSEIGNKEMGHPMIVGEPHFYPLDRELCLA